MSKAAKYSHAIAALAQCVRASGHCATEHDTPDDECGCDEAVFDEATKAIEAIGFDMDAVINQLDQVGHTDPLLLGKIAIVLS